MQTVEKLDERAVLRPPPVLAKLIHQDLEQGKAAAVAASTPHYRAAGEKLIEAKSQMKQGEFVDWVDRHFKIGRRQAQLYMQMARATADMEKRAQAPPESLHQFRTKHLGERQTVYPQPWHQPVKEIINSEVIERMRRQQAEQLTRDQERNAERKLGLQLIDIGYRVLATKFHPDKGGSRDAMARLNRVRANLKHHV